VAAVASLNIGFMLPRVGSRALGREQMTVWEQRALSVLRIVVSLLFIEHGTAKLFGFPTAANHPEMFQLLWFAAIIEAFGGLLLAIGLFIRPVAFIMSG